MDHTQSIIVYRSIGQQVVDQALWVDGGIVYFFIVLCAGIAGAIGMTLVDKLWRGQRYYGRSGAKFAAVQYTVGALFAGVTAYLMWV